MKEDYQTLRSSSKQIKEERDNSKQQASNLQAQLTGLQK